MPGPDAAEAVTLLTRFLGDVQERAAEIARLAGRRSEVLEGAAGERWSAGVLPLLAEPVAGFEAARGRVSSAVDGYAREVAEIALEMAAVRHARSEAGAWQQRASAYTGDPVYATALTRQAGEQLDWCRARIALLCERREAADATYESALRRATGLLVEARKAIASAADPDSSAGAAPHAAPVVVSLFEAEANLTLLNALAGMTVTGLAACLKANPELGKALAALPPATITGWWQGLRLAQRESLAAGMPRIIGNLDGIPADVRDRVNHAELRADLKRARSERDAAQKAVDELLRSGRLVSSSSVAAAMNRLTAAKALVATLTKIQKAYGGGPSGEPPHQLYVYEPGEHIMVAVSTGLIQDASHITLVVPGMGTTADNAPGYTIAARDLRAAQSRVSGVPGTQLAVIAWLDYVTPAAGAAGAVDVFHGELAGAGAERLAGTVLGLDAIKGWAAQSPNLSLVGHSYGTNVVTRAVAKAGVGAGNIVLLGSAGIEKSISNANALNVPAGQVFATQAAKDGWAGVGQYFGDRTDPTDPVFGAHAFDSEDDGDLRGVTGHGPLIHDKDHPDKYSYLDRGTTALSRTASATMGKGASLPTGGTPTDRFEVAKRAAEFHPPPTAPQLRIPGL